MYISLMIFILFSEYILTRLYYIIHTYLQLIIFISVHHALIFLNAFLLFLIIIIIISYKAIQLTRLQIGMSHLTIVTFSHLAL